MASQDVERRGPADIRLVPGYAIRNKTDPKIVAGLWRSLSGMTHGYPYAAHNNSEVIAALDIPGGQRVTYSINDTSFDVHALASTTLLISAIGIYIKRTRKTS